MRKITANKIYTISHGVLENGVVMIDESGKILEIFENIQEAGGDVEKLNGILVPGFINAHCHLELSHMKGVVPTGTKLIPFITSVVQNRDFPKEYILEKIAEADQEMLDNGIVAVGDISNALDTVDCKEKSKLDYYTFVEMFDFLQEHNAQSVFDDYKKIYDGQSDHGNNKKSAVPHAPYSVSTKLFSLINQLNHSKGQTVSLHNQETQDESDLFYAKSGGFIDFYKGFGIDMSTCEATQNTSLHYALQHMDSSQKTLLVHNTLTTAQDIKEAKDWNNEVFWVSCPNANLYIENRLPNYNTFIDADAKMCLGTDSLTSNWQLSILEEIKTISRFQSYVNFDDLIKWATLNGAEALGYDDRLGSIENGKSPGINLLFSENGNLDDIQSLQVRRII